MKKLKTESKAIYCQCTYNLYSNNREIAKISKHDSHLQKEENRLNNRNLNIQGIQSRENNYINALKWKLVMSKVPIVKNKRANDNNTVFGTVRKDNSLSTQTPKKRPYSSSAVNTPLRSNAKVLLRKKFDLTKPLDLGRSNTKV